MNARTHSTHGLSPFEVVYRYLPLFNIPVGQRTGHKDMNKRIEELQEVREDTRITLEQVKREQR